MNNFHFMKNIILCFLYLLLASPTFATVYFDGSDDAVTISDQAAFRNMSALTISVWMNRSGTGGGGNRLVSGWNDGTNQKVYQLYINNTSPAVELNCDTTDVNYQPFHALSNGTWYHLAAVYTGETVYLYVNGTEIGNSTTPSGDIVNETSGLGIGSQPDKTSFGMFNGYISDVAIWNTNLSADEIKILALSRVKGIPKQMQPANLILYLPLYDYPDGTSGDGDTFYDDVSRYQFTGDDGANNTGLTATAEAVLSYP